MPQEVKEHKSVTLDEFITEEIKNLLAFSSAWRTCNADTPEKFPMELVVGAAWMRQYHGYVARTIEDAEKEKRTKVV